MAKELEPLRKAISDLIENHNLRYNSCWRHKGNQNIYTYLEVAYDSDREALVVQYQPYGQRSAAVRFSHLVSRFLDSFEEVEQTAVWTNAN